MQVPKKVLNEYVNKINIGLMNGLEWWETRKTEVIELGTIKVRIGKVKSWESESSEPQQLWLEVWWKGDGEGRREDRGP